MDKCSGRRMISLPLVLIILSSVFFTKSVHSLLHSSPFLSEELGAQVMGQFLQQHDAGFDELEKRPSRPTPLISTTESSQEQVLRQIIRKKLSAFKEEVLEALDLSPVDTDSDESTHSSDPSHWRRMKRAVITADNPLLLGRTRRKIPSPLSAEGSYHIRSVFRVSPQYFDHVKTLDINAVVIRNQTYMFTLEFSGTNRTEICLYLIGTSLNPKVLTRVEVPGATSLEVIKIDKYYYVLPLVYNWTASNAVDVMDVGSNLYRVDLTRETLVKVQTIRTAYARSSVFWQGSGEEANDIYLAVAPEFQETPRGRRWEVQVPCYRWQGGYFDYVSSVAASNPQAIRYFNIFSHDYLAISNYQDNSGSTNIHSEVFKYHHKESRFISFQRIRTYGAKDIQHFSFRNGQREEHFLALANHCQKDENGMANYRVKSFIMKFASHRFVPFKSFYTYGALQFLPVTVENKFYLVLAEIKGIRIFQYNGWSFVQTFKVDGPELTPSFYSIHLRPFLYENQPYFAVSSVGENYQGGLYSVQLDQRNNYDEMTSMLEKWCLSARSRMDEINLTALEEQVEDAPKTNHAQIRLSQPLTFAAQLQLSHLYAKEVKFEGGIKFDSPFAKWLLSKEKELRGMQSAVEHLSHKMSNVLFRNKAAHQLSGKIIFDKVEYHNEQLNTDHSTFATLNGVEMSSFLENLIYTNEKYNFSSLETDRVEIQEGITTEKVNGSALSDYAVKHSRDGLHFTQTNSFVREVTTLQDVHVKGLLSGVDFHHPNFLLAQGNQTFQGGIKMNKSRVESVFTKYLHGEEVDYYFDEAVPLEGDSIITGQKRFKEVTIEHLHTSGHLNGLKLDQLYNEAIYTKGKEYQHLHGRSNFAHLVTDEVSLGNVLVSGKYNLEKEFVNIHKGTFHLGDVQLNQDALIQHLSITEKLNSFSVVKNKAEILLSSWSEVQRVKNKKLSGLEFSSNVEAEGLVDGVNLKHWTHIHRIPLKTNRFNRKYSIRGNLSVPNKLAVKRDFQQGQYPILPILKHIGPLNSTKVPGTCSLTFDSLHVGGNTELRREINGHKTKNWLLKNYPGVYNISGTKRFKGDLTVEEDATTGALYALGDDNQENILKLLGNVLVNGKDQTIRGDTAFTQLLTVDRLECPNVVLGSIPFENLFLKSSDYYEEVDVESAFKGHVNTAHQVDIKGNLEVKLVNGIPLREAVEDTLRTAGPPNIKQIIQGEYTFNGALYSHHMETDGRVGGYHLANLFSSIILKDRKSAVHITGSDLTFLKGVSWPRLEYSASLLNGIPSASWGRLWLLSDGNQTIYTPVEFLHPLKVDSPLYVENGRVGGLNVLQLSQEMLKRNEGGYLGHVTFESKVKVTQDISQGTGGKLNGVDLRTEVLLKKHFRLNEGEEQVVTGEKTFKEGWTIDGNLSGRKIDELDLSALFKFLLNKEPHGFQNEVLVIEGDMRLVSEPTVLHSVNGQSLKELFQQIWFRNKDTVIRAETLFTYLNFSSGGHFSRPHTLLSGINLHELKRSHVSKRQEQTWTGSVLFQGGVTFQELKVGNLLIKNGLFNTVNIEEFAESVLLNGTDQVLYGDFNLEGMDVNRLELGPGVLINDVNLLGEELMSVSGPNNVTGKKRIKYLETDEIDLQPHVTLLDGVNLTEWALYSLKTRANHEFSESLVFENLHGVQDIKVGGLVDGVNFDRDHILLKNGAQSIHGKMRLKLEGNWGERAAFTAPQGLLINGHFNNYDLNTTFSNLVRKSENSSLTPLVIQGEKVFLSPIRVDHIRTENLYQGVNMTKLLNEFYSGLIIPSNLTFRAKERYEALDQFTRQALQLSTQRAVFVEYFVLLQEIWERSLYTRVLYGRTYPTIVLGLYPTNGVSTERWWAYSLATDYYQLSLGNRFKVQGGQVVDYGEVDTEYGHFIILSVSSLNSRPVQLTNVEIERPTAQPLLYEINKGTGRMSKTFILKSVGEEKEVLSQLVYGKRFGNSERFVIFRENRMEHCILLLQLDRENSLAQILCLRENGLFVPLQGIPLENPTLVRSMEVRNRTLLILLTETEGGGVLHTWSHSLGDSLFQKESCLPLYNGVSMDAVFGWNSNAFLVIASGPVPSTRYAGAVFIYRYEMDRREWDKVQTLEVDSPLEVRLLRMKPSAELFLFVLTQTVMDNVLVYKYEGVSGWTLTHRWSSEGAKSLQVSHFQVDDYYKAQVLVSAGNVTRVYSAQFKGLSSPLSPFEQGRGQTFDLP